MPLLKRATTLKQVADAVYRAARFLNPRVMRFGGLEAVVVDVFPDGNYCLAYLDERTWYVVGVLTDVDTGEVFGSEEPPVEAGPQHTSPTHVAKVLMAMVEGEYMSWGAGDPVADVAALNRNAEDSLRLEGIWESRRQYAQRLLPTLQRLTR